MPALFSRTLDDVSHQFPEIVTAARSLISPLILDGEVVAWKDGRVLSVLAAAEAAGPKEAATTALMEEIPVASDDLRCLFADGRDSDR